MAASSTALLRNMSIRELLYVPRRLGIDDAAGRAEFDSQVRVTLHS